MKNVSQAGIMQLPNWQAVHKIIACPPPKKQNKVEIPDNPRTIQELELSHEYKIYSPTLETKEEKKNCLLNKEIGQDRIIIFWRGTLLEHIANSKIWYTNGTIAIVLHLFYQVHALMVNKCNCAYLILYSLLAEWAVFNLNGYDKHDYRR